MSEHQTTDLAATAAEGKRVLQQMHDQGVIDLDAPMRQLFDRLDTSGDVSGYQLYEVPTAIEADVNPWWVYVQAENDGKGGKKAKVLMGTGLKEDGLNR